MVARRSSARTLGLALAVAIVYTFVNTLGSSFVPEAAGRRSLLAGIAAWGVAARGEQAEAFDNAVKKITGVRTPGPAQSNLGVLPRGELEGKEGLKACGVSPNCFSSTYNALYDLGTRAYEPWHFEGKSPEQAMKEVLTVIGKYKPGQGGVDGGGFEVKTSERDYIYVQFEQLKIGYVDDVEFALAPGTPADAKSGDIEVRSSSRWGYYDMGVNSIRLNALASEIEKLGGWKVTKITPEKYPGYWKDGNCKMRTVQKKYPTECGIADSVEYLGV